MTDDEVTWDDVEAFARGLGDEYRIMWAIKDPPSEVMIADRSSVSTSLCR